MGPRYGLCCGAPGCPWDLRNPSRYLGYETSTFDVRDR